MEDAIVVRIIRRNNRGMTRSELVLDESCQKALGTARANNTNPMWPVVGAEPASLKDYWDALERHDWYYAMSDDSRVYNAGQRRREELLRMAELLGDDAKRLFRSWETARAPGSTVPVPERPL